MHLISSVAPALAAAIKAEQRPPTIVPDPAQSKDDDANPQLSPGPLSNVEASTRPGLLNYRSFAHAREVPGHPASRMGSTASVASRDQSSTRSDRSTLAADDVDRSLIASIAHGNHAAFRELHWRYYHRITKFARTVTSRPDLVEEVANDTLWVVWRCAARFKGESKVSSWIMGITRNLSFKAIRAMTRNCDNGSVALEQQAYEPSLQSELTEWVDAALEQLPFEQRTVLEMFYRLGQSCEEIAQVLNCPINTVKGRMFHGRRKMRELLPRIAGVAQST